MKRTTGGGRGRRRISCFVESQLFGRRATEVGNFLQQELGAGTFRLELANEVKPASTLSIQGTHARAVIVEFARMGARSPCKGGVAWQGQGVESIRT